MKAESAASGLRSILVATAIAGVFGYAIQLLAPRMLQDGSSYVAFSVFWSALYLGVSAMSGVQQEVARAAHPASGEPPTAVLRTFTLWAGLVVVCVSVIVAVWFGGALLQAGVPSVAAIFSVGLVGYLANAVLSGVLYGLRLWTPVAALIVIDVVIRAALTITGFAAQLPTAVLALFVAIPFGASFGIVWLWVRRRVIGAFRLDVSLSRLSAHVVGTVGAAAASGVMITGLPMLIGVIAADEPAAVTGALILAITLTRAPIVIPVIALQSFLISAVFRGGRVLPGRLMRILGLALVAVAALAALGWLIAPPLITWVSGGRFSVDGWMAATIVASAGLVAAMCVTGPALIAARRHLANAVGWGVAAAATILALAVPGDIELRVGTALLVAPLIGLLLQAGALLRRAGDPVAANPPGPVG
ncbi:hypothetical protein [Microbacterium sp. CH-015]|uniref:hypothetical protein n=1 Tax=Microbacterium sp. CH-015 TaxID=3406734 RepID=UPI003C7134CD